MKLMQELLPLSPAQVNEVAEVSAMDVIRFKKSFDSLFAHLEAVSHSLTPESFFEKAGQRINADDSWLVDARELMKKLVDTMDEYQRSAAAGAGDAWEKYE